MSPFRRILLLAAALRLLPTLGGGGRSGDEAACRAAAEGGCRGSGGGGGPGGARRAEATAEEESSETSLLQRARAAAAASPAAAGGAHGAGAARRSGACPSYTSLSTPAAQQFDPAKFTGRWWEVFSRNIPLITDYCTCSRYDFRLTGETTFTNEFLCDQAFPVSLLLPVLNVTNSGGFDPEMPGDMYENFTESGLSADYWVLNLWGDYEYALVYACLEVLWQRSEFVYFFSRTRTVPEKIRREMFDYAESVGVSTARVKEVPLANC